MSVTGVGADASLLGVPLRARFSEIHDDLRSLADGLVRELSPLLHAPYPIPRHKAKLTRRGGRCAHDGTPLNFDPWLPHDHACPLCGVVYRGLEHDEWWAMGAQLWSVERVLHASLLGVMLARPDLLALATRGLDALAQAWPGYPNRDNALGPTRPFFSTYLESVWLLNASLAAQVLSQLSEAREVVDGFCDRVVVPSRALIRSFPEGLSNRQAWHVAAQVASSQLLGEMQGVDEGLHGANGLRHLLSHGLLPDGSWYEGENYHLFAHRGLWYGVQFAESLGASLPSELTRRFDAGFRTPLLGMLPDGTFPSRRDSRYKVSVHQWRFAEWCELGLVRCDDDTVADWLQRIYASDHPAGDTGRARSTADIERDEPACALSRADLGWRTLLFARAKPWPARSAGASQSVVLEAQGLAVLRSDGGRLYAALEGGHTGGGHGHPDRLALTLQDGARRLLEDPGAGSYVERTLHWYRSTLAHNAPLIDGRSQERVATQLNAFESVGEVGWMRATARGLAPGVEVTRTVVLCDEHVVDTVAWRADRVITIDLPMHGDADAAWSDPANRDDASDTPAWHAASPGGAGGLEDGFDFLARVECAEWPAHRALTLRRTDAVADSAEDAGAERAADDAAGGAADQSTDDPANRVPDRGSARAWVRVAHLGIERCSLWRAVAPGPPRQAPRAVHWVRSVGASGSIVSVWSMRGAVRDVEFGAGVGVAPLRVDLPDAVIEHEPVEAPNAPFDWSGWRVRKTSRGDSSETVLAGARSADAPPETMEPIRIATVAPAVAIGAEPQSFQLGEPHYRGAEQSWEEAGRPTATVRITVREAALVLQVDAHTGPLVVPLAHEINPLDNERADVNADGVQLYLGAPLSDRWTAAWLLVPDPRTKRLRCTVLAGAPAADALRHRWWETETGWAGEFTVPPELLAMVVSPAGCLHLDLLVNERSAERERRRGQLVLSGSRHEFVYLRGDRHEPARALRLCLRPPADVSTTSSRPA